MSRNVPIAMALMVAAIISTPLAAAERQLTDDPNTNFCLDFNRNYSPDGKWLVYDTRQGPLQSTMTIEKVHVETGERVVLYRAPDPTEFGPGMGAASFMPNSNEAVFIHGPFTPTGLEYDFTRRSGAIVPGDGSGTVRWADARDVTEPYTPGALRGGSHRHDPGGPDGRWLGFTYNDHIVKGYGLSIGRDLDVRSLGVTHLGTPVTVDQDAAGENRNGEGFSVVIVEVVPMDSLDANPGTDAIYRATDDQWVGKRGYRKTDGSWQLARAFIGKTRRQTDDGMADHSEVYIVDIPDDITKPGPVGPLEGTSTSYPAPPAGASQRRLTRTERGCFSYVRSTSDGSVLSFMSADGSRPQIYTISPLGGEMTKVTDFEKGVREAASWLPDDRHIATVTDGRIVVVDTRTKTHRAITEAGAGRPFGLVVSHDGRQIAFNRNVDYDGKKARQVFLVDVLLPD